MLAFGILINIAGVHGMGQHFDQIEMDQFSRAVLMLLCAQFIVSLAIGMGKVVVAVFLMRIVTEKWYVTRLSLLRPPLTWSLRHKWFLWFCIVTMMFLSCFLSIVLFAQCTPAESIWNPELLPQQVCHISLTVVAFVTCCKWCDFYAISADSNFVLAWAAALDFILAGFPWVALRNLNMKRKERLTICASLSLGIL